MLLPLLLFKLLLILLVLPLVRLLPLFELASFLPPLLLFVVRFFLSVIVVVVVVDDGCSLALDVEEEDFFFFFFFLIISPSPSLLIFRDNALAKYSSGDINDVIIYYLWGRLSAVCVDIMLFHPSSCDLYYYII